MSILSKSQLRNIPEVRNKSYETINRELKSVPYKRNPSGKYDIFLSHRYLDAEIIYGIKLVLEMFGFIVYVDWMDEQLVSRADVNPETAKKLRSAMESSDSLLFAVSGNSSDSTWMPWELGYSDGLHGKVAIFPLSENQTQQETYRGQEYLGIYPWITLTAEELWVNKSEDDFIDLNNWLRI